MGRQQTIIISKRRKTHELCPMNVPAHIQGEFAGHRWEEGNPRKSSSIVKLKKQFGEERQQKFVDTKKDVWRQFLAEYQPVTVSEETTDLGERIPEKDRKNNLENSQKVRESLFSLARMRRSPNTQGIN